MTAHVHSNSVYGKHAPAVGFKNGRFYSQALIDEVVSLPDVPLGWRSMILRQQFMQIKDSELQRVQPHRRPFETRFDSHNYVAWRKQELHDDSMRQLKMSYRDLIWAPIGKDPLRNTYDIYRQMLQDAEKRINAEMRIQYAPYVFQDELKPLMFDKVSKFGKFREYMQADLYQLNDRPPRRKFLVNVVSLMFPDPGMHYTS